MWILIVLFVFFLIDFYAFQAVKTAFKNVKKPYKTFIYGLYWFVAVIIFIIFVFSSFKHPLTWSIHFRFFSVALVLCSLLFKFICIIFLFLEDIKRLLTKVLTLFRSKKIDHNLSIEKEKMSRSTFLSKLALGAAALPVAAVINGIARNAYRYQKHYIDLKIKNLPSAFQGLKIVQISDIHSGSFTRPDLVARGVDMINEELADLVFFTGDLVNFKSEEINPYLSIFSKIKAKDGVYSILGNHDYGDYFRWNNATEKRKNLDNVIAAHEKMGWKILIDEHVKYTKENASLAILGVGNWGKKFAKYGNLKKAYSGCETCDVKLLLSHDPSHWEGEIIPFFKDIDVTFSGHTHGFQFGIEIPGIIKWSPVQWVYKQWAGLYQIGAQQIYVNRGFGFHALPGRVGILPEISVFTLKKA